MRILTKICSDEYVRNPRQNKAVTVCAFSDLLIVTTCQSRPAKVERQQQVRLLPTSVNREHLSGKRCEPPVCEFRQYCTPTPTHGYWQPSLACMKTGEISQSRSQHEPLILATFTSSVQQQPVSGRLVLPASLRADTLHGHRGYVSPRRGAVSTYSRKLVSFSIRCGTTNWKWARKRYETFGVLPR
ncbi:hypothetical protein J6590_048924 [Homalodisca vitripennis]|nr:hypothetical protein J6590_048924 [Homalodisca vitripennis]